MTKKVGKSLWLLMEILFYCGSILIEIREREVVLQPWRAKAKQGVGSTMVGGRPDNV
jgi:hypothetical protein